MKQFDVEKIEKEEKEEDNDKKEEKVTVKTEKSGFLPYLLGFGLGLIITFGIMYFLTGRDLKEAPTKETATTTTTEETAQTETNTEQSLNTGETSTPTPTPTETNTEATTQETAQTTLDKSKITIQLLNGNGIRGDAVKVKTILEKDGWKVTTYGNANNFNYQNTLVYYKKGEEEAAKAVAETLKNNDRQTAIHESTTLTKYDIQIILGKK
jgi:cytoskeletal protein RodZ